MTMLDLLMIALALLGVLSLVLIVRRSRGNDDLAEIDTRIAQGKGFFASLMSTLFGWMKR